MSILHILWVPSKLVMFRQNTTGMKKIICMLCLNFPFITFMSNCSVWTLCRWNFCMKRLPVLVYFYEVAGSTCSDGRSNSGMRKLRGEFTLRFLLQPHLLAWTTRADRRVGGWQSQSGERWWHGRTKGNWICVLSGRSLEGLKHRKEYLLLILNKIRRSVFILTNNAKTWLFLVH